MEYILIKIVFNFSVPFKDRPPQTYEISDSDYSGIRHVCPQCLAGISKIHAEIGG